MEELPKKRTPKEDAIVRAFCEAQMENALRRFRAILYQDYLEDMSKEFPGMEP